MGIDKYKELYNISHKLLEAEYARFGRISQKATAYLSVVSILFGIATVFGKAVVAGFIPPKSLLEWLILNLCVLIFILLGITWFTIFRAYKMDGLKAPPHNELPEFYHNNKLVDIYYSMSKAFAKATDENIAVTNRKADLLAKGYTLVLVTGFLTVVLSVLYFGYLWSPNSNHASKSSVLNDKVTLNASQRRQTNPDLAQSITQSNAVSNSNIMNSNNATPQ